MKLLKAFIAAMICLNAMAQTPARNWVDTEATYKDVTGRVVKMYNSLPKGGGAYLNAAGKKYRYVIFWTRVINESATPLELSIQFPADPFTIFPSPESHIRILLPPDSMTLEKIPLGDYGLINLQSFLNASFNKPASLQKTIHPKAACFFYIPVLLHQAQGTARAAFVVKGQDLFFKIRIAEDSAFIPCGRLVFKN